ncbi:MAG: AMP-binding protein, partial [Myxococcota bacterium]
MSSIIDTLRGASYPLGPAMPTTSMPTSILAAFQENVSKRANDPACRFRDSDDKWQTMTWADMDLARKELAAGLLALGFEPKQRAAIFAGSSEKWMLADLANQSVGGQTVPIYQSNTAPEAEYIINNCEAVLVFAEDEGQVAKLQEQKDKLANVTKVVVMNDATDGTDWTIGWSELQKTGRERLLESEETLRERAATLTPDDILTIIYTSGTTGRPKGAVLTHSNMLYQVKAVTEIGLVSPDDTQFLFLPMAHVFAKVLQCIWLGIGHEMAIDGNVQRVVENMGEVRPTMAASVPRVFEKV